MHSAYAKEMNLFIHHKFQRVGLEEVFLLISTQIYVFNNHYAVTATISSILNYYKRWEGLACITLSHLF